METPSPPAGREFPLPIGNERWAADHGIIGYNLFLYSWGKEMTHKMSMDFTDIGSLERRYPQRPSGLRRRRTQAHLGFINAVDTAWERAA